MMKLFFKMCFVRYSHSHTEKKKIKEIRGGSEGKAAFFLLSALSQVFYVGVGVRRGVRAILAKDIYIYMIDVKSWNAEGFSKREIIIPAL